MTNIFGITKEDLELILVTDGKKKFMATQIFEWIYNKHEYNVDNFSNINNDNKKYLKENFDFDFITLEKVEEDIDVKKFLFRLKDNQKILMYLTKLLACLNLPTT